MKSSKNPSYCMNAGDAAGTGKQCLTAPRCAQWVFRFAHGFGFPAIAFFVLLFGEAQAAAGPRTRELLASVRPAYEPTAKERSDSPVPAKAVRSEGPVPPGNAEPPPESTLSLAPVIVERTRPPARGPRASSPKIAVPKTYNKVEIDAFDTKEARTAKLVERRLGAFDRLFLNRLTLPFIGQSLESRAVALEAEAVRATSLNHLAQMIDVLQAAEGETEEVRELRKLHRELHTAGRR